MTLNKFWLGFLGLFLIFSFDSNAIAQEESSPKNIIVFVREGCTACAKEEIFLEKLRGQYFQISLLDIGNQKIFDKFSEVTNEYNVPKVTPITLVGGEVLVGFEGENTTGEKIKTLADEKYNSVDLYLNNSLEVEENSDVCTINGNCGTAITADSLEKITLPVFGEIDVKNFSLFSLASVLGFIDGFNPCAMWVLIAFLIALSQVGSKSRMMAVAGLFIIAESIMYFLILNVWYHTWNFIKLDWLILPIVGLVSLAGGIYFLYKFKKNNGQLVCDVSSLEHQKKTTEKIKDIVSSPLSIVGAFVIIGLAFSVNIIEFACSIGLPQTFTKILEINNVNFFFQQFYIGVYTLFYMVDDFIVFALAIFGYQKFYQFGAKYSNLALLIGGIILIILGVLMLSGKNVFVF